MRAVILGLVLAVAAPAIAQSNIEKVELPPSAPPPPLANTTPAEVRAPELPSDAAASVDHPAEGITFSAETIAEMEAARGFSVSEMMAAEIEARRKTAELNATVAADQAAKLRAEREALEAESARRIAEYEAELAARDAAEAEAAQRHQAEMAAWRAKVAACEAGDITQCAPKR